MKYSLLSAFLAIIMLLTGCASPTPTAAPSPAAPPTPSHSSLTASGSVTASANVVPAQTSQMGFLVSANVKEVNVKEGDSVKAGQTLVVLDTPDLSFSVTAADTAVQSAQADVNIRKFPRKYTNQAGKIVYLSGPPELRMKVDAQLVQAQASLDVAKATLAQGTLTAPYDGTIVTVNVTPGELVQPGQVAVVIGDLSHLQIETTDLSERVVANVKIGQPASVYVKALNQKFNGKVIAIAPKAKEKSGDLVYKVTIELDSQPQGLFWGMSADVNIGG